MSFFRRRLPKAFKVSGRAPADYAQEMQEFVDQSIPVGEGLPAGFDPNIDPHTIQAGVDAEPGDPSQGWMAVDATIAIETAAPVGLSNSNSEGTGTALLRASAGIKRDVRVAYNGADVGTRNRLNFTEAVTVPTDDGGNDQVNIPLGSSDAELLAYYGL